MRKDKELQIAHTFIYKYIHIYTWERLEKPPDGIL